MARHRVQARDEGRRPCLMGVYYLLVNHETHEKLPGFKNEESR